ncbi:hypothetical protein [Tautonia rosea]|uniref:hypothetical protein n=1 Tax=Tautonia rosea TaxID=2728037 RepID=UPI0019D15145|nr:hypothetical protein [Tautonia rosea]
MNSNRTKTQHNSSQSGADSDRPDPAPGQLEFPTEGTETESEARPVTFANGSGPPIPEPPLTEAPVSDPDPFDPARLRLSQDFGASLGVRKVLTRVPVDKPNKSWWVRTHPDPAFRLPTGLLETGDDRERYLVDPNLWPELAAEPTFSPVMLVTSVSRNGVVFLWPIKLPGPDGKPNPWHQSALDAAERARSSWVRVYANMALGAYSVDESTAIRDEPDWPPESFRELLSIAFRDRFIREWDHPVLKQLRGEA